MYKVGDYGSSAENLHEAVTLADTWGHRPVIRDGWRRRQVCVHGCAFGENGKNRLRLFGAHFAFVAHLADRSLGGSRVVDGYRRIEWTILWNIRGGDWFWHWICLGQAAGKLHATLGFGHGGFAGALGRGTLDNATTILFGVLAL